MYYPLRSPEVQFKLSMGDYTLHGRALTKLRLKEDAGIGTSGED